MKKESKGLRWFLFVFGIYLLTGILSGDWGIINIVRVIVGAILVISIGRELYNWKADKQSNTQTSL